MTAMDELDLEQERAENDARYADADTQAPLTVAIDRRERPLWDSYVGQLAGKHVLEVGAGTGFHAAWLASLGAIVTAIELSPIGVRKTLERARFHGLQGRVAAYCVDACRMGTVIAPGSIDIALGFSVLHHLPASECGRSLNVVLKPGGRVAFFENSNANPLYRLARRVRNNETTCGSPLTAREGHAFINEIGSGELIYPRFGLFGLTKKYVLSSSPLFATVVDGIDNAIDKIPFARRWSAHMWVVAQKSPE